MISKSIQQTLSMLICAALLAVGAPAQDASQTSNPSSTTTSSTDPAASAAPAPAPFTSDQLDAMVGPIALYPDALVAQALGAATFPDQVAIADYWLTQNKNLTGAPLIQAVDQQTWDPSVKALTQFPTVLHDMATNLAWTSSLGQAFHEQQADVMAAVQTMRAKAQAAGTLKSTPQVTVVQQTPQTIVIQPANPQVVYVPQYNPTVVYGAPYVVPLYTPSVTVAAATVSFGAGVAIGAAFGGTNFGVVVGHPGWGWGWNAWHCNWGGGGGGGNIIFNNNTYITNNNWHGGGYYPYHPWGPGPHGSGPYGPHPYGPNGYEPNGGRNGDHGLIGGNGGVQHTPYPHADGNKWGDRNQPNGGFNGDHGLIGGNGGVQHTPDPHADGNQWGDRNQPNGGFNGDHGLIGGNGGVQHTAQDQPNGGRNGNHGLLGGDGANQSRSRASGNGWASRAESNRGRASLAQHQQHAPRQQAHVQRPQRPQQRGGGGRRR